MQGEGVGCLEFGGDADVGIGVSREDGKSRCVAVHAIDGQIDGWIHGQIDDR